MSPRVVLVGLPGAGKSVVGRLLADRLGVPLVETDDLVAGDAGVAEVFLDLGEEAFRERERAAVATALTTDGVVVLGGGAIEGDDVRASLAAVPVVFLDVADRVGMRRAGLDAPRAVAVGSPRAAYRALAAARRPFYEDVAAVRVDTSELSPEQVADAVLGALHA